MAMSAYEEQLWQGLLAKELQSHHSSRLEQAVGGHGRALERVQADQALLRRYGGCIDLEEAAVVLRDTTQRLDGCRVTLSVVDGKLAIVKRFQQDTTFQLELVRQAHVNEKYRPTILVFSSEERIIATDMGPEGDLEAQFSSMLVRGPPPRMFVPTVLTNIALALESMFESGYCHLDIKPANIVMKRLDWSGLTQMLVPVLIDFGSTKPLPLTGSYAKVDSSSVCNTEMYAQFEASDGMISYTADMFPLGRMALEMYVFGPWVSYGNSRVSAFDLMRACQGALASGSSVLTAYARYCGFSPPVVCGAILLSSTLMAPAQLLIGGGWTWAYTVDCYRRIEDIISLTEPGAPPEHGVVAFALHRQLLLQFSRTAPKTVLLQPTLEAVAQQYIAASEDYASGMAWLGHLEKITGQQHTKAAQQLLDEKRQKYTTTDLPLLEALDREAVQKLYRMPKLAYMTEEQMYNRYQMEVELWDIKFGDPAAAKTDPYLRWAVDPADPDEVAGATPYEKLDFVSSCKLSLEGRTQEDDLLAVWKRREQQILAEERLDERARGARSPNRSEGALSYLEERLSTGSRLSGSARSAASAAPLSSPPYDEDGVQRQLNLLTVQDSPAPGPRPGSALDRQVLREATNLQLPAGPPNSPSSCAKLLRRGLGTRGRSGNSKSECTSLWLCNHPDKPGFLPDLPRALALHENWESETSELGREVARRLELLQQQARGEGGAPASAVGDVFYVHLPILEYATELPAAERKRWEQAGLLKVRRRGGPALLLNPLEYPLIIQVTVRQYGLNKKYCGLPLRDMLSEYGVREATGPDDAGCGAAGAAGDLTVVFTELGAHLWHGLLRAALASPEATGKLAMYFSLAKPATLHASADWEKQADLMPS